MTVLSAPSEAGARRRSPRRVRYLRRAISIPIYSLLWVVSVAGLPLLLPLAGLTDLARRNRRLPTLRCYALVLAFTSLELAGVARSTLVWARPGDEAAKRRGYERLQAWWAAGLYRIVTRVLGIRITVEGSAAGPPGPVIIFARHVSIADAVLPVALIGNAEGRHMRYVLRSVLAWDPCLDLVGNRLPHSFVRKGSGQAGREVAGVVSLLDDLRDDEGVTIFIEGGLTTAGARERLRRRLTEKGDAAALANLERYRHLMPPRPGGPSALLAANPGADIIFFGHAGFEGGDSTTSFWRGTLVGRRVRAKLERVPFAEVPTGAEAQAAWLNERWLEMDAWVADALASGAGKQGHE